MANFKNPKNQPDCNKAILSPSKTRSPKSGTQVPPKSRKSRKSKDIAHRRVVIPSSTNQVAALFLSFTVCFNSLRDYVNGCGGQFTTNMFVLFMGVCAYGGGIGVVGKVVFLYAYKSNNGSSYRMFCKTLRSLVECGLVSRVKVDGFYRYRVSVTGDRLIRGVVDKEVLREVALVVRTGLAS